MTYIATFYSHFGAIRFKKLCEANGLPSKLMPVPRSLSSSCGTCVSYTGELTEYQTEELEQLVLVTDRGYQPIYRAEQS